MIVGCMSHAARCHKASAGMMRLAIVPTFRAAALSTNMPICSTQLPMNATP